MTQTITANTPNAIAASAKCLRFVFLKIFSNVKLCSRFKMDTTAIMYDFSTNEAMADLSNLAQCS